MKVKELLSEEIKWTKEKLARDKDENPCDPRSMQACKWCLSGAILRCYYSDEANKIMNKVTNYLGINFISYNDKESTSFKNIKELVEILDI